MAKRRTRKTASKAKPNRKSVPKRDKFGRFISSNPKKRAKLGPPKRDASGRFVSKPAKVLRKAAIPPKRKAPSKRKAPGKAPSKRKAPAKSFGETVLARLKGTPYELVSERYFKFAKTYHRTFTADPSDIPTVLSDNPDLLANGCIVFIDANGELQFRSTATVSTDEPELLNTLLVEMLNKYNTAKEIAKVERIEVDIWGKA